jgi:Fe(3+) dicitrate transport protein
MTRLRGFSILSLLFSLSSIAQNKIAGMITDGDGKINAVEVNNRTNQSIYDAWRF